MLVWFGLVWFSKSFLYVMGCQIRYLRSMKGSMNLIRTRKHIKSKVLLLKFGVHHQLKPIQIGTRINMLWALDKMNLRPSRTVS